MIKPDHLYLVSNLNYLVRLNFPEGFLNLDESQYLAGAYLPGVKIVDDPDRSPDFTVNLVDSETKNLLEDDRSLTLKDSWSGRNTLDQWHLLYSLFRKSYLQKTDCPVHASCVGLDNMVLLAGHTGVGKTTVTMRLLNDLGWKIFSGNKTVVDPVKMTAVAGTKTISIRQADIAKYPKLQNNAVNYSNLTALFLDPSHYDPRQEVPLKAICILRIDDGNDQTVELTYPGSLHALYPYFLDTIYADTVLCDGRAVYSGEVERDIKERVSSSMSKSLQSIKVLNLRGSVKYLVETIKTLI